MPMPQSQINNQLFGRLNSLESKVDETNGYLRGVVESNEKLFAQNDKLITLLERRDTTQNRVLWALLVLLLFAIGVIAFGAIGKEGMHSVRQTLPNLPPQSAAIPAHNDFDKWRYKS